MQASITGGCPWQFKKLNSPISTLAAGCLFLFLTSACSSPSIVPHFDSVKNEQGERVYGTLSFYDDINQKTRKLEVARTGRGTALKAALDKDQHRTGDFMVMRHREFKWFAGVHWRFTF